MTYHKIKAKVEEFGNISSRPMFGYQCYSVGGKVFVGFSKKDEDKIIARLPKESQPEAIKNKGINPFSHGAKAGWIEINSKNISTINSMKWIIKSYENAKKLAKNA